MSRVFTIPLAMHPTHWTFFRAPCTLRLAPLFLSSCTLRLAPLFLLFIFFACSPNPVGPLVLNDFEADADLDRIHWSCRQLYSLSTEHVASGRHSLEMKLYPADYPGLALKLGHRDWRRYDAVAFDIFNPHPEALEITVRIDDKTDYPEFEDRYNERFTLAPGATVVRIPFEILRTSGGDRRRLDLSRIFRFMFFLVDNRELRTLFVDDIRLEGGKR